MHKGLRRFVSVSPSFTYLTADTSIFIFLPRSTPLPSQNLIKRAWGRNDKSLETLTFSPLDDTPGTWAAGHLNRDGDRGPFAFER